MTPTKNLPILLLAVLLLAACARSTPAITPSPQAAVKPFETAKPTSAPPSPTSASPTLASLPLATPYSDLPAAGICAESPGESVVVVEIMPDIPTPRCLKVTPEQRLRVVNRTNAALALKLGNLQASLSANGEYTFDQPFGRLLAQGVHILEASPYFGPEIWLVEP